MVVNYLRAHVYKFFDFVLIMGFLTALQNSNFLSVTLVIGVVTDMACRMFCFQHFCLGSHVVGFWEKIKHPEF